MKVKYVGPDGGTAKAVLTHGKIYHVEIEWKSDFVGILDDHGVFVDLWLGLCDPLFKED